MKKGVARGITIILATASLFISDGRAFGAGFALYEGSARGNALGGTLVGRADDPSALFYNPAGITQLPGTQVSGGLTVIYPISHITTEFLGNRQDTKLKSNWFYPPNAYVTYQKNDRLWFGVGFFARFGLGTQFDKDWPGRYNSYNAVVKGVEINPNVAYKITDRFSVAAGLSVMRLDIKLQQMIPLFNVDSTLKGHSYGWGYNFAFHYRPCDWMAVGFLYRSKVKHTVHGNADFIKPRILDSTFPNGTVHADVTLPDEYFFGVVFRPINRLSFEVDAIMTRWHNFDKMKIRFDDAVAGMDSITKQKSWHDVWRYQMGLEYALTRMMDIRFGYVYDNEPIPGRTIDYLVPSYDRQLFSCGLGFHWEHWSTDVSYTYLLSKNRNIDARPADGVLKGRLHDSDAQLIGFNVGYKF